MHTASIIYLKFKTGKNTETCEIDRYIKTLRLYKLKGLEKSRPFCPKNFSGKWLKTFLKTFYYCIFKKRNQLAFVFEMHMLSNMFPQIFESLLRQFSLYLFTFRKVLGHLSFYQQRLLYGGVSTGQSRTYIKPTKGTTIVGIEW